MEFQDVVMMDDASTSLDILRKEAKHILVGNTFKLAGFLAAFSSDDADATNLLDYLRDNHRTALSLRLISLFQSCQIGDDDTKNQALDLLCFLFTKDRGAVQWIQGNFIDKELKSAVLGCLKDERSGQFSPKILSLLSKIAMEEIIFGDEWPEAVEFICGFLVSCSEQKVKCSLLFFYKLIPRCTGKRLASNLDCFPKNLICVLTSETSFEIKALAASTATRYILYWMSRSKTAVGDELLNSIVEILKNFTLNGSDRFVKVVVKELNKLVVKKAKFMTISRFTKVVESIIMVMDERKLNVETTFDALEFVFSLAEASNRSRRRLRRSPKLLMKSIETLLLLRGHVEVDEEWQIVGSGNEKQECLTVLSSNGMKGLGRISAALGWNVVLDYVFESCSLLLGADQPWQRRRAAFTSLAVVSKSCPDFPVATPKFSTMIDVVSKLVKADIHPRVRWTALNIITDFSLHLGRSFRIIYHHQLLEALTSSLDDFSHSDMQVQAASAIVEFVNGCSDIIEPYLKVIVPSLLGCMERGERIALLSALRALKVLMGGRADEFKTEVMPYVKDKMHAANMTSDDILFAACSECFSALYFHASEEERHIGEDVFKIIREWHILTDLIEQNTDYIVDSERLDERIRRIMNEIAKYEDAGDFERVETLNGDLKDHLELKEKFPDSENVRTCYGWLTEEIRRCTRGIHESVDVHHLTMVETLEDVEKAKYFNAIRILLIEESRVDVIEKAEKFGFQVRLL